MGGHLALLMLACTQSAQLFAHPGGWRVYRKFPGLAPGDAGNKVSARASLPQLVCGGFAAPPRKDAATAHFAERCCRDACKEAATAIFPVAAPGDCQK